MIWCSLTTDTNIHLLFVRQNDLSWLNFRFDVEIHVGASATLRINDVPMWAAVRATALPGATVTAATRSDLKRGLHLYYDNTTTTSAMIKTSPMMTVTDWCINE